MCPVTHKAHSTVASGERAVTLSEPRTATHANRAGQQPRIPGADSRPKKWETEGVRLATLQLFQQCPSTWKNVSISGMGLVFLEFLL